MAEPTGTVNSEAGNTPNAETNEEVSRKVSFMFDMVMVACAQRNTS